MLTSDTTALFSCPDLELTVATITTETSYVLAEVTCHSRCSEASYVFFKNGNKITSGSSRHRGYFYPGDTISCALERYEDYRSPSLCELFESLVKTVSFYYFV